MVRLAKPSRDQSDDDDEFPDVATLVNRKTRQPHANASRQPPQSKESPRGDGPAKPAAAVRRRKLGPLTDNLLLRAWTPDSAASVRNGRRDVSRETDESTAPRRTRVELRTRKSKPTVVVPSSPADHEDDFVSAQEEVTIIEEVSMVDDDSFHSCDSDGSDFKENEYDDGDEDDDFLAPAPLRSPAKQSLQLRGKTPLGLSSRNVSGDNKDYALKVNQGSVSGSLPSKELSRKEGAGSKSAANKKTAGKELGETMSRLRLDESEQMPRNAYSSGSGKREVTPPSSPSKSQPGLVSPRKLPRIPVTPHRPSSDMFWSQEFIDEWNDEHSPRKQLFPDAMAARQRSPSKDSPEKRSRKASTTKVQSDREAKKAFEKAKHEQAEKFLQELDTVITNGKLAELAASTGGIKLIWTNKLNTTAGRANWKRETIRNRAVDGTLPPSTSSSSNNNDKPDAATATARYKHHASIELAEKVIDDEHRLLNVLAHEFCHLANFMISNITTQPHGAQFKAWAAQCSRAFAHRGVEVTTKHAYEIDFKYVWECDACGMAFKRHSKSIDPARHRCGSCKGELRQTKPVPRKKKGDAEGGGGAPAKVSEYQVFMKEQMRVVREEFPKTPQKDIMKIVASRWAQHRSSAQRSKSDDEVQEVAKALEDLTV